GENLGRATQHHPAEPRPVFVPAIGNKRGGWIFDDVSEAFERPDVALRLLIDRDVERPVADDKTNRDEMRRGPRIGGGKMTDPATGEKTRLLLGQHSAILHDFGRASQTLHSVASSWVSSNQRGRP